MSQEREKFIEGAERRKTLPSSIVEEEQGFFSKIKEKIGRKGRLLVTIFSATTALTIAELTVASRAEAEEPRAKATGEQVYLYGTARVEYGGEEPQFAKVEEVINPELEKRFKQIDQQFKSAVTDTSVETWYEGLAKNGYAFAKEKPLDLKERVVGQFADGKIPGPVMRSLYGAEVQFYYDRNTKQVDGVETYTTVKPSTENILVGEFTSHVRDENKAREVEILAEDIDLYQKIIKHLLTRQKEEEPSSPETVYLMRCIMEKIETIIKVGGKDIFQEDFRETNRDIIEEVEITETEK